MKEALRVILATAAVAVGAAGPGVSAAAGGSFYETTVHASGGEKFKAARYRIWIPDGVEVVRAVIVHQHGCGRNGISVPYDVHWQELGRKWDCALMGTHYEVESSCTDWSNPENGSGGAFIGALRILGEQSGHGELVESPWVLWGHSGGAAWAAGMLREYPERVVAVFLRSLPWGEGYSNESGVPVLLCMGAREKEGRFAGIWKTTERVFGRLRGAGATVGLAVDPQASHDCRHSRLLAIPFFDSCLGQRLVGAGQVGLRAMDGSKAWLGDLESFEVRRASEYEGDKGSAAWLPDEATARRWREFVRSGWVTDLTAPEPPFEVKAVEVGSRSVTVAWKAEADVESGIKSFYYYRDGVKVGGYKGPVDKNYNPEGGFQKGNYGDEPVPESLYEKPEEWEEPRMRFTDTGLEPGSTHTYTISTVNWSDLESARSEPLVVTTGGG